MVSGFPSGGNPDAAGSRLTVSLLPVYLSEKLDKARLWDRRLIRAASIKRLPWMALVFRVCSVGPPRVEMCVGELGFSCHHNQRPDRSNLTGPLERILVHHIKEHSALDIA